MEGLYFDRQQIFKCHKKVIKANSLSLFFIGLLSILFIGSAQAQTGHAGYYKDARFFHLSINDGLSQNLVSAIHQDHLGLIWVGTKDGLNMYDGYNFTIYKHDPLDPHSISDNFIKAIYTDKYGRLWIGTLNGGLNLFDRKSRRFTRFMHDPNNNNTISSNNVQAIVGDLNGNIWIGTGGGGLNKLIIPPEGLLEEAKIKRFSEVVGDVALSKTEVFCLTMDRFNTLWVGTNNGVYAAETSDAEPVFRQAVFEFSSNFNGRSFIQNDFTDGTRSIFVDNDGELWLCSGLGLFTFSYDQQVFVQYDLSNLPIVTSDIINATSYQNRGFKEIWLSYGESVFVINTLTGEFYELKNSRNRTDGLQKGRCISLFVDRGGTIWLGSNGHGLSLFDPFAMKFVYHNDALTSENTAIISSRDLSIRSFIEIPEQPNVLWIGANEGFFRIDRLKAEVKRIHLDCDQHEDGLIVYNIQSEKGGILWLGTNCGLVKYDPFKNSSVFYPTNLHGPGEGFEPRVTRVLIRGNDIWVLTPNTIALFNKAEGTFEHIPYTDQPINQFRETVFPFLHQDKIGNYWIGAQNGLHYFDATLKKVVRTYQSDVNSYNSLKYNYITAILPDPMVPDKFLWLATAGGGLNRFDLQNETFTSFTERDGLANNTIYGMLADGFNNFWISTNHGLSKFQIDAETFVNYTVADGLQSNEFNSGAFYLSHKGELFFGGINGYNSFYPSQIKHKEHSVPVVFTAFKILNDPIDKSIQDSFVFIEETNVVDLNHNQNNFSIEFSALDFANPAENHFDYSLATGEDQWISMGKARVITFTDVKPGSYTLKVRGTNNDGIMSEKVATLQLNISKPWWRGNFANAMYILISIAIIIGLHHYEHIRLKLKNRIKMAGLEALKLRELDHLKSQFFANISHEFRTPLTLIKGPLEQMLEETKGDRMHETYRIMHSNVLRLLSLINQILDLSKLEHGLYNIKVSTGDIIGFLKGIVRSFGPLMDQKNIEMRFLESKTTKNKEVLDDFYFDKDVIEKIMNNLLSNAIKFIPPNGRITICICIKPKVRNSGVFEIFVKDNGIGIPADKLPYIYERFYQVDASSGRAQEGSGVGLAFVKELVAAHKGTIGVKSKLGVGTTFRVQFPIGKKSFDSSQIVIPSEREPKITQKEILKVENHPLHHFDNHEIKHNPENPLVLIIEDHEDVRTYIRKSIEEYYNIIEASNATEGILLAIERIPDLIVSDVMMPEIDGFECCRKMKSDAKTSHIPIILLTAKATENDKLKGLELGADDYLTKPFSSKELLARIKNLIEIRSVMRDKFSGNAVIKPGEISVSSADRIFIEKLVEVVESNISREDFGVEDLGAAAGMSQSQLHRKLKSLINQSGNHFIRSIRMHRAKMLLEREAGNITEVAFMVGYGDPGYFTKNFRNFFGMLPSEVKNKYKQN